MVDLPTPPLPDATAITFLMLVSGFRFVCTACEVILELILMSALSMPGTSISRVVSASRNALS